MTTMYVTYPGDADTWFDRDYYVSRHLPLVMESWGKYGLLSSAAFFPAGDGAGTIAICECRFRDEESMRAALASSESKGVMKDVTSFTDAKPRQSLPKPV